LIGIAMLVSLMTRDRLDVNVLHDRNPQYVVLSDGSIRNGYTVKLLNMVPEPRAITLTLEGLSGAVMQAPGLSEPESRTLMIELEPDRLKELRIFVRQPADHVSGEQSFTFVAEDPARGERAAYQASFVAPEEAAR